MNSKARRGAWWTVACVLAMTAACGKTSEPGSDPDGGGASGPDGGGGSGGRGSGGSGGVVTTNYFASVLDTRAIEKADLVFMIDNSLSMGDKQAVLKEAVPDLVRRLVSPNCVNAEGRVAPPPADSDAACPAGYAREFAPVRDLHVGVITSSLGGHGAEVCKGDTGVRGEQQDDRGHLIATRPRFAGVAGNGASSQPPRAEGFLDWNPAARGGAQSVSAFTNTFQAMVTAAGEFGCGYESQLESIYRFLVDPHPHERLEVAPCSATNPNPCAYPVGIDAELLSQRAAFLRPDSAVGIVLISDENDCSIIESEQGFYVARDPSELSLPRATAICATNPNDACCTSCISSPPEGCEPDPSCASSRTLPPALDAPNLRCFNQKKRFGLDFLYPTARYVNALKLPQICTSTKDLARDEDGDCPDGNGDGEPDLYPNPLFVSVGGSLPRDDGLVFLAGIVGVPWQDLKADAAPDGTPYPDGELHYQLAARLDWGMILGSPNPGNGAAPIAPKNTLMVESLVPRSGRDGQGNPLAPPSSSALANPVNSHEWGNTRQDDLQYACIFQLPEPRDCAAVATQPDPRPACDCETLPPGDDNPLCQNPETNQFERNQFFAKAYPGLRELEVLKGHGENSIVASICARNVTDETAQDYGYRPAMSAIVDRIGGALGGRCLPRQLTPDADTGEIPCSIVEAQPSGGACQASRGRRTVDDATAEAARGALATEGACGGPGKPDCSAFELCEIEEAGPECHRVAEQSRPGWCYIDPSQNPADDPLLVESCPFNQRRLIRFVDPENATPAHGAAIVIVCKGAGVSEAPRP